MTEAKKLADYWQTSSKTAQSLDFSEENHFQAPGLKIRVSLVQFRPRAQLISDENRACEC